MRRPLTQTTFSPNTFTTTIPAPILGLNEQFDYVNMPPTSAIQLENFTIKPAGCESRKGSQKHATGFEYPVETLMAYNAPNSANNKLFACSNTVIYDVTTATASPSSVQTGLVNARWEYTNFTTPANHYLVAASGAQAAKLYDGTNWINFSQVASPATPGEVSGVDPATFNNVAIHKLRIWFTTNNSTKVYYLPINSVGGAAAGFDFGPYMSKGGSIIALTSWTIDAGTGMDDLLVAVSSEGEVLVYQGTDPSSSTTWSLVGVWQLASPIDKRCFMKFGGDVLYLSKDGLTQLSRYLQTDRTNADSNISVPIQQTFSNAANEGGDLTGWQTIFYPEENVILFNIPTSGSYIPNYQLVYNTLTKSWSSFKGWDASCWTIQNNKLYFGGQTAVYRAFVNYLDNVEIDDTGGNTYRATAQQAFNYFGKTGLKKKFSMVRISAVTEVDTNMYIGVNLDFNFGVVPQLSTPPTTTLSKWDQSYWDSVVWSAGSFTQKKWQLVNGVGTAASLTLAWDIKSKILWTSSDWVMTVAGIL